MSTLDRDECGTMRSQPISLSSVAPITLVVACFFSHVTGKSEPIPADSFHMLEALDDEVEEILGNAALLAALREADTNVAEGDLVDREDLPS